MSGDGCSSACERESGFACTERGVFEQRDTCTYTGSGAPPLERHDAATACALFAGNWPERANVNFITNFQLDAGACDAGQAFRWMRDDAVRRHNFARYLARVPLLPVSESRQDLAQQCALMIAANFPVCGGADDRSGEPVLTSVSPRAAAQWSPASLDPNSPPSGWQCRTAGAVDAAGKSAIFVAQNAGTSSWKVRPAEALVISLFDDGSAMLEGRQRLLCPNAAATAFGHVCYERGGGL